jgi:hypothetical protein
MHRHPKIERVQILGSPLGMGGEYEMRFPIAPSVLHTRMLFIKEVSNQTPFVLTNLSETCHRPYYSLILSRHLYSNFFGGKWGLPMLGMSMLGGQMCARFNFHWHNYYEPSVLYPILLDQVYTQWQSLKLDVDTFFLQLAIAGWSQQHNLDADWCRDHALRTLQEGDLTRIHFRMTEGKIRKLTDWDSIADEVIGSLKRLQGDPLRDNYEHEGGPWRLFSNRPARKKAISTKPQPPDGLPAWNAGRESRRSYLTRIENQVRDLFASSILCVLTSKERIEIIDRLRVRAENYCKEVSAHYEREQWKKLKVPSELARNVSWAVQFQVLKKPYMRIAADAGVETSTVRRSVISILKIIGLPPRVTRRGRLSQRKDSVSAQITRTLGRS